MTPFMQLRNLTLGASLLALAACGQSTDTADTGTEEMVAAPETPVVEEAIEGTENATAEMQEQAAAVEPADPVIPDVSGVGDPAVSFDPTDAGEQLFQRGFYSEALARWEEDAEAGSAYAAYRLGVQYYDAHHVERDIATSARWQQLGAELGSAPSMFELGSFHEGGLGVPHDMEAAADWYLESARRGFAPAQHNVATMFEDGTGVGRDLVQAHLFYTLSVEQGFRANFLPLGDGGETVWVDPRARLELMMSEEELAAAADARESFEIVE